ncbi:hypothetical protein [Paenibacillus sp. 453mf]|uniref:hypothetical protein n=1 Tax=Paenibacillus sp. 453mf TaxID=1761874 RepID=UPI0008E7124E|nr:hypothetical protein [Paenibacillus sp. 453mf]SFS49665.1 hypothetical protein SAMN04488601_1011131 [Paenibacillus sp. 453mf]
MDITKENCEALKTLPASVKKFIKDRTLYSDDQFLTYKHVKSDKNNYVFLVIEKNLEEPLEICHVFRGDYFSKDFTYYWIPLEEFNLISNSLKEITL